MAHGAGGKATRRLIEGLIAPVLGGPLLDSLGDAAFLELGGARLAVTADSFVVRPLRFPGGSIGDLAVNGTVNDLAVAGAKPVALLVTLILEAGLSTEALEIELRAVAAAARQAGVSVVGGDTKVVEHGEADGMYITTAGIGIADIRVQCAAASVRPGDRIMLSGPIGDHGITILLARGELDLEADLCSDTRSVYPMIERLVERVGGGIRWMRDPTRGGVASALNELAADTRLGIVLWEDRIPVRDEVRGACELLGLEPLHIANEGQFLAVLAPEHADAAIDAVRSVRGGEGAVIIGEVREQPARTVLAASAYGGSRVVDMLVGDPLPRIC
ncbi:MAG: hydrogenase expression/formation protein HypE [Gemmatimonadaceae bacterium]|nr:hydrogenase expression/formation protein HypE [Gemmatimonadaceae bacterium]